MPLAAITFAIPRQMRILVTGLHCRESSMGLNLKFYVSVPSIVAQVKTEDKQLRTFKSFVRDAPWIQPVVLETVWGVDLTIPGSRGAARACAWFSPTRREGMVELRLF